MAEAPDALTPDDLIAWGLDWQRHLSDGPSDRGYHVPLPVLQQYVVAANAALMQQRQRDRKKARSSSGRPKGGMGEQKLRLTKSGVLEADADRMVAQAFGKPIEAVRRATASARKKPPT
jgi:hypothetical protein